MSPRDPSLRLLDFWTPTGEVRVGKGKKTVRIKHRTGLEIAEGPLGWGITPFEGNFYIRRKHLKTDAFRPNWVPGLCVYKFLFVWMDLDLPQGGKVKNAGWLYFLPNPLFPFIWYRVGLSRHDPEWVVDITR